MIWWVRSWLVLLVALLGCKRTDPAAEPTGVVTNAPKPPDDMDEKMRHCPLALDGAVSTMENVPGGVRFTVAVPEPLVTEVRRRAHEIVDFAAKRTTKGHGEFDGKGGRHMKNCPVVTDDVTITVADVAGGTRLEIVSASGRVDALRAEARRRAGSFPFAGARIDVAP